MGLSLYLSSNLNVCRNNGLYPVETPAIDFVIQNKSVSVYYTVYVTIVMYY